MSINYDEQIPNNVGLSADRRLQRALENWQPKFLEWWNQMGPCGFQTADVYLRTATSVDAKRSPTFAYRKTPDYRPGFFLATPGAGGTISSGAPRGRPVWPEVP